MLKRNKLSKTYRENAVLKASEITGLNEDALAKAAKLVEKYTVYSERAWLHLLLDYANQKVSPHPQKWKLERKLRLLLDLIDSSPSTGEEKSELHDVFAYLNEEYHKIVNP